MNRPRGVPSSPPDDAWAAGHRGLANASSPSCPSRCARRGRPPRPDAGNSRGEHRLRRGRERHSGPRSPPRGRSPTSSTRSTTPPASPSATTPTTRTGCCPATTRCRPARPPQLRGKGIAKAAKLPVVNSKTQPSHGGRRLDEPRPEPRPCRSAARATPSRRSRAGSARWPSARTATSSSAPPVAASGPTTGPPSTWISRSARHRQPGRRRARDRAVQRQVRLHGLRRGRPVRRLVLRRRHLPVQGRRQDVEPRLRHVLRGRLGVAHRRRPDRPQPHLHRDPARPRWRPPHHRAVQPAVRHLGVRQRRQEVDRPQGDL